MTDATRWAPIQLWRVLSRLSAMRLQSLSFENRFSTWWRWARRNAKRLRRRSLCPKTAGPPCQAWVGYGQRSRRLRTQRAAGPTRSRGQGQRHARECQRNRRTICARTTGLERSASRSAGRGLERAAGYGLRRPHKHEAWSTGRHGCARGTPLPRCCARRRKQRGAPLCKRCAFRRAHRAVQQRQPICRRTRAQRLEHPLPPAAHRPAPEAVVNAGPATQLVRQVAPRRPRAADPQRSLDKPPQRRLVALPSDNPGGISRARGICCIVSISDAHRASSRLVLVMAAQLRKLRTLPGSHGQGPDQKKSGYPETSVTEPRGGTCRRLPRSRLGPPYMVTCGLSSTQAYGRPRAITS